MNVLGSQALHVVAFLGDATGDGTLDSSDVGLMEDVVGDVTAGFNAYKLADPAVIGDIAGYGYVSLCDGNALINYVNGSQVVYLPPYPAGLGTIVSTGPYPTVSIPSALQVGSDSVPAAVPAAPAAPANAWPVTVADTPLSVAPQPTASLIAGPEAPVSAAVAVEALGPVSSVGVASRASASAALPKCRSSWPTVCLRPWPAARSIRPSWRSWTAARSKLWVRRWPRR